MSFAYWKKCDFQVHTPRDPNWTGPRPIGQGEEIGGTGDEATPQDVDAARAKWAKELIDQCVAKGLEAIALTDHHEMIMVPYVQQEIANRKRADFNFDIWLFPGMELTATGGKQCLILFDVDLSEDWRKQAQGKLGIIYADLDEKSAKGPSVTQLTSNYADRRRLHRIRTGAARPQPEAALSRVEGGPTRILELGHLRQIADAQQRALKLE